METFKEIPEFTNYEISNFGRIRTKARMVRYTHSVTGQEYFRKTTERFLKVYVNNRTGYKFCQLYKDKKMYNCTIHRLVASVFISKPKEKDFVNHIDGNKHNNFVENLEWCTNEYNHYHATKTGLKAKGSRVASAKLTEPCIPAIKRMLNDGISHSKIAEWFGVSRTTISLINAGKIWSFALTGEELTAKG